MLRSRLFWKLFLGFTAVNIVSACALAAVTWRWQASGARKLAAEAAESAAALLEPAARRWAREPTAANADELRRLAGEAGVRVTVQSPGRPRFESTTAAGSSPARQRPEAAARRPLTGRSSESLGVVRVTRLDDGVDRGLAELWGLYSAYAAGVGLLMLAAGFGVVAHLVAPVRSLDRVARAMARGDHRQRAFVANRDELGALARSFNDMNAALGKQLAELSESDRRQATVLGGMIEGVVAIDERHRVLFANPAAGGVFGFLPSDAQGRPLLETIRSHPLHRAAKSAIASARPQRLEIDWEERVLSVQVTPLPGEPPSGAVVVLHDTTELRRLESLRRDFVANVSHELKTPLASIKAFSETLLDGADADPEVRERFLRQIESQAERLAALIHDLLSLARIESAQQPFEIQTVQIASAVEACLSEHQRKADGKAITLAADRAGREANATQVKADPEGLRTILNNLIDNAIKYTAEGGEVAIRWSRLADSNTDMIRIDVADTGVGIPAESLARVFERFYRVDTARSRELGGTGLGLSIVKHLAQSFGGSVSVASEPNRGATFSVTLPAA